jgi:hypothetical protein
MKPAAFIALALLLATSLFATADISITYSVPRNVFAGVPFTKTITVTNLGPDTATGVQLGESLAGSVDVGTAVSSQGPCSVVGITGFIVVNCGIGTLASGASETIALSLTAPSAGPFIGGAAVSSTSIDPNGSNNVASQNFNVLAATGAVPALSPAILALLAAAVAAMALLALRR